MMPIKTIYLAGPDVFLPNAIAIGRSKMALCDKLGLTGLFPLDNDIDLAAPDASRQIFLANQAMMDRADAIIANLTPFRGPSADAGTVYELGYMAGKGKRCFGYCNDTREYADRVTDNPGIKSLRRPLIDLEGLMVEDFGLPDNLMIVHALELYGCPLVVINDEPQERWHDLDAFEQCLKLAAAR
jgi:nucleoside 2-deoxyribosyltransferase